MYATADEVRRRLRLPDAFTADEEVTADLLIELAVGAIEEEAGQALEQSTDTVLLDGTGTAKLILPRWPVTAVVSVTLADDDEELAEGRDEDYTWSASGVLTRRGACWPCGDRAVDVTLTAGFTVIPPGLKRIVLRLAAGAWGNPESLSSETLGDHARSWSAEALGMELSATDRRTIAAYKART